MAKTKKEKTVQEDDVVNPGDCIGHWEDGNKDCSICEIEESCKAMTETIDDDGRE